MKKNKKNKIFAVAVISAILCGLFCITAFAWDSDVNVLPVVTDDFYSGYSKILITSLDDFSLSPNTDASISSVPVIGAHSSTNVFFEGVATISLQGLVQSTYSANRVLIKFPSNPSSYVIVSDYISGSYTSFVSNGGVLFVSNDFVSSVASFFNSHGVSFSIVEPPDPTQVVFDNVSQGVTGSLDIVSSTASLLTTNTILSIMCVALPLVSFGVGLLIRLKERS